MYAKLLILEQALPFCQDPTFVQRLQDYLATFSSELSYTQHKIEELHVKEFMQWAALLQYCKKPFYLESYASYLVQDYREEINNLFMQKITEKVRTVANRSHYQSLHQTLQNFKDLGFQKEVISIVTQLKELYPKRPALHDELSKIN